MDISDAELSMHVEMISREKEELQSLIRRYLPARDEVEPDIQYHLREGSNAWALGDKGMWRFHKNQRERMKAEAIGPMLEAKDTLATVIEQLNPYADEVLRREGKFFVYDGDVLGDALKTVTAPPQSAEWHAQRAKGIGGSDVAAILGVSPWNSREELFQLKTGQKQAKPTPVGKGALWRGAIWEDAIAREYQARHADDLVFVNCKDSWKSSIRDYQTANLDGLIYSLDESVEFPIRVLEIKTSSVPGSWSDGVPYYYRLQSLWYMDAFGIQEADFAVMVDDVNYHEFKVVPEPGEMDDIHTKVGAFVDEVQDYLSKN